jgi:hypothetical protein
LVCRPKAISESEILRKIFAPKRKWQNALESPVMRSFVSPNIVVYIKLRMRCDIAYLLLAYVTIVFDSNCMPAKVTVKKE